MSRTTTVSPALLDRIKAEFTEMPGLKLTIQQACRLWGLDEVMCQAAVDELILAGFLFQAPSRAFIAVPSALRMLKVEPHLQSVRRVQDHRG